MFTSRQERRSFTEAVARSLVPLAVVLLTVLAPARVSAQSVRTITACTPDALGICADLRLTSSTNFFEIGIRAITATGTPTAPISLYNLIFGTGGALAAAPISNTPAPVATGGATVSDPTAWDLFDEGNVLFLSALSNRGIGECVAGADVDGFGQAARTCGAGQWITFGFTPSAVFDPNAFTLLSFEAVALTSPTQGASCGGATPCRITADVSGTLPPPSTTVPEPSTIGLFGAGLLGLIGAASRRRKASMRGLLTRHGGALSVTTALLLSACSDTGTTPASPLSSLRAVANNTPVATPGFAWLAPLGTTAANPVTFDAAAAPTVEVCAWSANACVGAPVARFSTTPVSPVLPLTVNTTVGQYQADWSLMSTAFTSRRTYRIRTLQAGVEIGAVSVDVVRGRWALTRTDGTLAPLVSASALPIRFAIAKRSVTPVTSCDLPVPIVPDPDQTLTGRFTLDAPNTNASAMLNAFDATPWFGAAGVEVRSPTGSIIAVNNVCNTGAAITAVGRYTTVVFSPNGNMTLRMKEDDQLVRFVRESATNPLFSPTQRASLLADGFRVTDRYLLVVNEGGPIAYWDLSLLITIRPTVVVVP